MIAVGRDEDLGLVTQAAERNGVDDAVAVALEGIARAARAAAVLGMEAATAVGWVGSAGRQFPQLAESFSISCPSSLVQLNAASSTSARDRKSTRLNSSH